MLAKEVLPSNYYTDKKGDFGNCGVIFLKKYEASGRCVVGRAHSIRG
jgi:hypothetical protein